MSTFTSTVKAYLNFAVGMRQFLRKTYTVEDIISNIRQQVDNREENFLNTIRTSIFDYPQSPYLPLLKRAKLTHADIERLVVDNGLEGALEELYNAGVYVTFEELKGRIPIKRGDLEYHVTNSDFDNPNLTASMLSQSSGSTGAPSRTKLDLDFVQQDGNNHLLMYHIHEILGYPLSTWGGILPDTTTLDIALRLTMLDDTLANWFTPYRFSSASPAWYYTLLTVLSVGMVRLQGAYCPFPQHISMNDPLPIIRWIIGTVKTHGGCVVIMAVSKAVRLSLIAQEQGFDLTGATFMVGGEPSTDAKIKSIEDCGAKHLSQYSFTEAGMIGMPCRKPNVTGDMHFMRNHMELIQCPIEVFDQIVDSICLTTLLPSSPKMLLNAQTDDFGIIETRDCGCPVHELGLHQHMYNIRSYRKLTGEGVTLVGTDMETILEQVFPSKFGGSLLDYQLVEEEDEQGFTKLLLYVAPHIAIEDEQQLIDTLLDAMKKSEPSVQLAQPEYQQAQTIAIRRRSPMLTPRGKYFSIYTLAMNRQMQSQD